MSLVDNDRQLIYVSTSDISTNPNQPRKHFSQSALKELAQSIKECGVLQPICVRRKADGGYELVAGERRLRASKLAGSKLIPAWVREFDDKDSSLAALIENLQRENLNYMEEAEAYLRIMEEHRMTQAELAAKVGRSQSYVGNKLRLLQLPQEIKQRITEMGLSERHARALLRLRDEALMKKVFTRVVTKKLNVKQTEELVTQTLERMHFPGEKSLPLGTDLSFSKSRSDREKRRVKNIRIFINTIKETIKLLKLSGVDVRAAQFDKDGYFEFVVRIPKQTKFKWDQY